MLRAALGRPLGGATLRLSGAVAWARAQSLVPPPGIEPGAFPLGRDCSNPLSYEGILHTHYSRIMPVRVIFLADQKQTLSTPALSTLYRPQQATPQWAQIHCLVSF